MADNSISRTQPARQPIEFPEFLVPKRPPPSINENVFAVPVTLEQDGLVLAVRAALLEGRAAAERSYQLAIAVMGDERLTEVSRHKSASEAIYKVSGPAMLKLQGTIERVAKKVADLQNFLSGPPAPTSAVQHWQQMEIRNALAGMKPDDRREAVIQAIKAGNETIASSVLRCPPFVAGVTAVEQEDFRQAWAQASHPREVEYLASLKSIEGHLDRAGQLLLNYGIGLTSPTLVKRADASQRRAEAALAGLQAA